MGSLKDGWLSILSKQSNGQKKRYIRRKSVSRTRCKKPSFIYRHNDLTPNKKHKKAPRCYRQKVEVSSHRKGAYKTPYPICQKGRPTPKTPIKDIRWQITADILPDQEKNPSCETAQSHLCYRVKYPARAPE